MGPRGSIGVMNDQIIISAAVWRVLGFGWASSSVVDPLIVFTVVRRVEVLPFLTLLLSLLKAICSVRR